jgi:hypothetical protein
VLVVWATRRFLGEWQSLLAGLLMALAEPLQAESVRGLRLEFELVLLTIYLVAAFRPTRKGSIVHAIVLGLLGGLLALTRSTYLPATIVLSTLSLWQVTATSRSFAAGAAIAAMLTVGAVVPHRYALYRVTGDPFNDTAYYARWNANMEFAGTPGFPTKAELEKNAYVGPHLSYAEYMFKLHTPREIAVSTFNGLAKLFFRMDLRAAWPAAENLALQALALFGFLLAVTRGLAWIPLAFLLIELPVAFLYDRKLVEPYRHTFVAFPLILWAVCLSLMWMVEQLRVRVAARRRTPS